MDFIREDLQRLRKDGLFRELRTVWLHLAALRGRQGSRDDPI
jgi:hypothetical protein